MSLIQLKNVSQTFVRDGTPARILRDVNLEISAGEFVCVVGPSGCGKSTLLNGIGGFVPFTGGEAFIDGQPIGAPDKRRGVVFQDYPILDFMTAIENVEAGLHLDGLFLLEHFLPFLATKRIKSYRKKACELLDQVGLTEHAHKFPKELSGGQRQRVAIAQAVAMQPEVLLMDEPFSGLDPATRESLQLMMLKFKALLGGAIFFITHDLEEAVFLGDRVLVLSQYGNEPGVQGATIVHEEHIPVYTSSDAKKTANFGETIQRLRSKFNPGQNAKQPSASQ